MSSEFPSQPVVSLPQTEGTIESHIQHNPTPTPAPQIIQTESKNSGQESRESNLPGMLKDTSLLIGTSNAQLPMVRPNFGMRPLINNTNPRLAGVGPPFAEFYVDPPRVSKKQQQYMQLLQNQHKLPSNLQMNSTNHPQQQQLQNLTAQLQNAIASPGGHVQAMPGHHQQLPHGLPPHPYVHVPNLASLTNGLSRPDSASISAKYLNYPRLGFDPPRGVPQGVGALYPTPLPPPSALVPATSGGEAGPKTHQSTLASNGSAVEVEAENGTAAPVAVITPSQLQPRSLSHQPSIPTPHSVPLARPMSVQPQSHMHASHHARGAVVGGDAHSGQQRGLAGGGYSLDSAGNSMSADTLLPPPSQPHMHATGLLPPGRGVLTNNPGMMMMSHGGQQGGGGPRVANHSHMAHHMQRPPYALMGPNAKYQQQAMGNPNMNPAMYNRNIQHMPPSVPGQLFRKPGYGAPPRQGMHPGYASQQYRPPGPMPPGPGPMGEYAVNGKGSMYPMHSAPANPKMRKSSPNVGAMSGSSASSAAIQSQVDSLIARGIVKPQDKKAMYADHARSGSGALQQSGAVPFGVKLSAPPHGMGMGMGGGAGPSKAKKTSAALHVEEADAMANPNGNVNSLANKKRKYDATVSREKVMARRQELLAKVQMVGWEDVLHSHGKARKTLHQEVASWLPATLEGTVALFGNEPPVTWQTEMDAAGSSISCVDIRQLVKRLNVEAAQSQRTQKQTLEAEVGGAASVSLGIAEVDGTLSTSDSAPSAAGITTRRSGAHASAPVTVTATAANGTAKKPSGKSRAGASAAKEKASQEEWVYCDLCGQWRLLPDPSHPLYPSSLPDRWTCSMNTWQPALASCNAEQEVSKSSEAQAIREQNLKVWVRRLRSADKYEARCSRSSMAGRRFGEVDWIRCSSSTCGKWRACLRSMDGRALREKYPVWYCWMTSWDEARSSCDAPQEGTAVHSLAESTLLPADDEDDEVSLTGGDPEEDSTDEHQASTFQGISSRGRIVRSRWSGASRRNRR